MKSRSLRIQGRCRWMRRAPRSKSRDRRRKASKRPDFAQEMRVCRHENAVGFSESDSSSNEAVEPQRTQRTQRETGSRKNGCHQMAGGECVSCISCISWFHQRIVWVSSSRLIPRRGESPPMARGNRRPVRPCQTGNRHGAGGAGRRSALAGTRPPPRPACPERCRAALGHGYSTSLGCPLRLQWPTYSWDNM